MTYHILSCHNITYYVMLYYIILYYIEFLLLFFEPLKIPQRLSKMDIIIF